MNCARARVCVCARSCAIMQCTVIINRKIRIISEKTTESTYGRRAFSVAGIKVWNSLPDFIRGPDHQCRLFQTSA